MADVSEHHSEEEGEGHHVESSGVDFFIVGDTVCSNDFMIWVDEFVDLKVSRWVQLVFLDFIDLSDSNSTSFSDLIIDSV